MLNKYSGVVEVREVLGDDKSKEVAYYADHPEEATNVLAIGRLAIDNYNQSSGPRVDYYSTAAKPRKTRRSLGILRRRVPR